MTKASTLHLIDRLQFPWLTASTGPNARNNNSVIPIRVEFPLPAYRFGAVSAGVTHKGRKMKEEEMGHIQKS